MTTSGFFQRSELTRALRAFRGAFLTVAAFSMVANVLQLTSTLYMLQVYDRVLISQSELTLLMLSLVTLFFYLVGAFSEWMRSRVLVHTGMRLDDMLGMRVFNAAYESTLRQGTATGKAFGDLMQVRQFMTGPGVLAILDTPWTPIYLAVLFFLHPMLGWLAIGFALVQLALVWFGHRLAVAPTERAQNAMAEESLYVHAKLRNTEVLEPMGMVHNLRARWQAMHRRAELAQARAMDVNHRVTAVSKFIRYSQQSLALGAGALLVIDGQLTMGAMIAANMLMTRALAPIDMMANTWRSLITARAAFRRLETLLQENPERDPALTRVSPEGALRLQGLVAVAPGRAEPILKGVDLRATPGAVTVVLGPSGSGKSTLARCMIGIWPHMQGEVLLDERPISGWNRDELGPHIGYLPQDIELFEGSIAENIARFGEVDAVKVIEAAREAGLHEMILRFPKGYDTPVGEAGGLLSGGQRQRIGLARALYGKPVLVVLDEPNANLDDMGEAALVEAIQLLRARGSTVIVVTHRPGVLAVADRLVVLRDGVVRADGSRDEVLAALRNAQARSAGTNPQGPGRLAGA
jgi:ATP-binding cassette subfamily C exporter for protease/lipase